MNLLTTVSCSWAFCPSIDATSAMFSVDVAVSLTAWRIFSVCWALDIVSRLICSIEAITLLVLAANSSVEAEFC